jgi:hypothetical protein
MTGNVVRMPQNYVDFSKNQLELPSNQNNRLNSNQPSLLTSDPIDFTEPHNSGGSNIFNAIDTRLQEFQTPEKISSVFEPIFDHFSNIMLA